LTIKTKYYYQLIFFMKNTGVIVGVIVALMVFGIAVFKFFMS